LKNKPAQDLEEKSIEQVFPKMNKRQFLINLAAVIGTSAAAQLACGNAFAVAMSYQAKTDSADKSGKVFSQYQMQVLADICAVVLPRTDTPSAAELDVHGFIDHQLFTCYDKKLQAQTQDIVEKIDRQSKAHFSKSFTTLAVEQQRQLLLALEAQGLGFTKVDNKGFKGLKSLLVFGYFTTEVGATQALSYQAVPGGFKGSISYDSVGKSYGALAYY